MSQTKIAINRKDKSPFKVLSILVLLSTLFNSCKQETVHEKIVDSVEESKLELTYVRFEKELYKVEHIGISKLDSFNAIHSNFFELYNNRILGIGSYKSVGYTERLSGFLNDKIISSVAHSVDSVYSDFHQLKELTQLFKAYHVLFPKKYIPKVYTFISGFSYAIAPTDSVLGIGLDYFLGNAGSYYTLLQLPEYQKRKLFPEYLAITAFEQWVRTEFENDSLNKDLLSQMIAEGKMLYAVEQCNAEQNDTLLFGFTEKQLMWCKESEAAIWSFMVDKKLLYLKNKTDYNRYIVDGPFTPGMPRESPARAICWVGYQIVKSFMKYHPKMSIEKMMAINNAQYILNNSKYKPNK